MFQTNKPQYDPTTGELIGGSPVVNQPHKPIIPNLGNARPLESVAGRQPQFLNLRDHAELNGVKIAIVKVTDSDRGEYGPFVKIAAYPLDENGQPGNLIVIMTGAENVMTRALTIQGDCSIDNPIIGVLEKVGDAWLLN